MQLDAAAIVWALAWPPAFALLCAGMRRMMRKPPSATGFWACWLNAAAWTVLSMVLPPPSVPGAVIAAVQVVIAVIGWWLSRRRKRRAPKLAGDESLARLRRVVRTMRERSRPRPVPRLAPGGAR